MATERRQDVTVTTELQIVDAVLNEGSNQSTNSVECGEKPLSKISYDGTVFFRMKRSLSHIWRHEDLAGSTVLKPSAANKTVSV